jgi:uncharacterized membrane protein YeaQ/YmgE (transglycosylase-associated protein family)
MPGAPTGQVQDGGDMLLLGILVFGMFVGWLAHLIVFRGARVDWTLALIAGVAGSFVGGLLASLLAGDGLDLRPSGIIGSLVGAVLVLLGVAGWKRRSVAG